MKKDSKKTNSKPDGYTMLPLVFREYFKLPLEIDDYSDNPVMVWTADRNRAFDFSVEWLDLGNKAILGKKTKISVINAINAGKIVKKIDFTFSYRDGYIYISNEYQELGYILFIRSWGRLTGTGGGLNLTVEKATEIQDSFGNYIADVLNGKDMSE